MIYLDTSALSKLIIQETGSDELETWLAGNDAHVMATSTVGVIELIRVSRRSGDGPHASAKQILATNLEIVVALPVAAPVKMVKMLSMK